ncbi:MAG: NAD(P)/FAD-dependent oxidoreductase [Bacillota bacterium]|nr:NAD(P)/FAD-dependent oxidoreductase [Bacillota bacterium]
MQNVETDNISRQLRRHDLIVIGSGGGLVTLDRALAAGYDCALIEKGRFGGTCLTRGCIPTKILATAATLAMEVRQADRIGVETEGVNLNWQTLSRRVQAAVNQRFQVEDHYRSQPNCHVYTGSAAFTADGDIEVSYGDGRAPDILRSDRIVIATGGHTRIDPLPGLTDDMYLTSETLFAEKWPRTPPDRLLILGGGPVGVEFAHIFHEAGTRVTLAQRNVRLLPQAEPEISGQLLAALRERGIVVHTDTVCDEVMRAANGEILCRLRERTSGRLTTVATDQILLATGIVPHTELQPERAGIQVDERGWIQTNEYLETSRPGVWAIGDVNGRYSFRHVVNQEAICLADNLFPETRAVGGADNGRRPMRYDAVPQVTFSAPEVAHAGLTAQAAQAAGHLIRVARRRFSQSAKGQALGHPAGTAEDGLVLLIIDAGEAPGRLLGAHIIGPEAALLLQPLLLLLGAPHADSRDCDHVARMNAIMTPHPALSEAVFWAVSELGGPQDD